MIKEIIDPQLERYTIAAALRHPGILADVSLSRVGIKDSDYGTKLNKTIYSALVDCYKKEQEISPYMVAQKIKNLGISFTDLDGDILDYLEEVKLIQVSEKSGLDFFKQLKCTSVRNEIAETGERLKKEMIAKKGATIDEIVSASDAVYSKKFHELERFADDEFYNIYGNLERDIMERANNPIQEYGPRGPYRRMFQVFGSLLRPQNITLVAARTGTYKSTLAAHYLTHVCDEYKCPILHLDCSEMTSWELQCRAVNMLSGGKVPYSLLEKGTWIHNEELKKIVPPILKKVQKMQYEYREVGGMTDDEIISSIRRFYFSKVGRGNYFAINHDYPKSFDAAGKNPEWLQMDYFLRKIKNVIKDEVYAGYWCSQQQNRSGIAGNKPASQIDDSEATIAASDRISHAISHGAVMRWKTAQEQAEEPGLGNIIIKFFKARHLGDDPGGFRNLVEMNDGSLQPNKFFMKATGFSFEEVGDLASLKDRIGIIAPHHDQDADDASLE